MSRKNNKTITAIGMAAFMTAAGVLTAMAAQSPTIVAGSGMSQSGAAGPGVQSPEAQEQAPIWGTSGIRTACRRSRTQTSCISGKALGCHEPLEGDRGKSARGRLYGG